MSPILLLRVGFCSNLYLGSLLSFTLLFTACDGDSLTGPETGVAMSRVHAGNDFTCGIVDGGTGLCWGINDQGQLGIPTALYEASPQVVSEDLIFRQLSTKAAGRHVCGIVASGDAYCWGQNDFGQIGNGSTAWLAGLHPVVGGLKFASISAGWRSSCGVTTDGDAYCWGRGEWGQLGDGLATLSSVPVAVAGGHHFKKVDVGSNNLVCGLVTTGSILCWGLDLAGALGAPSNTTCVRSDGFELRCAPTPQAVAADELFIDVSAGSSFACGITEALRLLCWGRNNHGQLGRSTTETCSQAGLRREIVCGPTPMPVSGVQRFASVGVGPRHACAVTVDGDAYCWGRNSIGELGSGAIRTDRSFPMLVRGGQTFRTVSAGEQHSCGEGTDGELYCWGSNAWGQLGTGDTRHWLEPTRVITGR